MTTIPDVDAVVYYVLR